MIPRRDMRGSFRGRERDNGDSKPFDQSSPAGRRGATAPQPAVIASPISLCRLPRQAPAAGGSPRGGPVCPPRAPGGGLLRLLKFLVKLRRLRAIALPPATGGNPFEWRVGGRLENAPGQQPAPVVRRDRVQVCDDVVEGARLGVAGANPRARGAEPADQGGARPGVVGLGAGE